MRVLRYSFYYFLSFWKIRENCLDTKTSGKGFVSPVILKVLIFPKGQFSRCLQRARLATQKAAFERQQYATISGAQRAQCLNLYIRS